MPKGADYSPLAQAERVAGYLCHIRAEGPQVLIGHSLGAAIVLLSALSLMENEDRPELVGIVVVSGAVYAQPLPRYLSLLRRRLLGELFLLFAPPRTALNVGFGESCTIRERSTLPWSTGTCLRFVTQEDDGRFCGPHDRSTCPTHQDSLAA